MLFSRSKFSTNVTQNENYSFFYIYCTLCWHFLKIVWINAIINLFPYLFPCLVFPFARNSSLYFQLCRSIQWNLLPLREKLLASKCFKKKRKKLAKKCEKMRSIFRVQQTHEWISQDYERITQASKSFEKLNFKTRLYELWAHNEAHI